MTHKKKVLIDCDGVVCDFMGAVVQFANASGKTSRQWKYEEITGDARKYPFWSESGLEEEWLREGFCSSLPVIEGAQDFVEKLRSDGFEVLFVTSPPRDGKYWTFERKNWLEKNFKAARGEVIFATDKRYVSGLTLIDDHVDNCLEWNGYNQHHGQDHLHSIMVAQPWNQKAADYKHRTNDFNHMIDLINEIHLCEIMSKMHYVAKQISKKNNSSPVAYFDLGAVSPEKIEEVMSHVSEEMSKDLKAFIVDSSKGGRRYRDPRSR